MAPKPICSVYKCTSHLGFSLVISRKASGGTRSERGTERKMTLASVCGTWRAQGLNHLAACRQLLVSPLL